MLSFGVVTWRGRVGPFEMLVRFHLLMWELVAPGCAARKIHESEHSHVCVDVIPQSKLLKMLKQITGRFFPPANAN